MPQTAALAVGLLGGIALVGWLFHVDVLKSILPGAVTMKPNTALGFVLAAVALSHVPPSESGSRARLLARGCAVAVVVLAILTLCEHLFGWDLRIDELLFADDPLAIGTSQPGRMAPQTAVSFLLTGAALLLLHREAPRGQWAAQLLTLAALFLAVQGLISYLFGARVFSVFANSTQMAIHTATAFVVLCAGILLVRRDRALMAILTAPDAGGWMARRLLVPALAIPLVFGWLRSAGERAGYFDASFGLTLVVLSSMATLAALIGWNASALSRLDAERRRAEDTLQERAAWLTTTLSSIGDAVIATDETGRIVFINPVAGALTGWTSAEAVGHPLDDVFVIVNEESRQPVVTPVARVLAEGAVVGLANHTVLMTRHGADLPIDDSGAPIRDERGRIAGVVLVFRDITARREAEQALRGSEARKSAMLEAALDCIISIDHRGRIVEWNPAAERTFGYTYAEAIGQEMATLIIPPSLREAHRRGLAHYLETGEGPVLRQQLTLPALRADGTEFRAELAITRIPLGGDPVFTGYLRDISARERAEGVLRESEERFRSTFENAAVGIAHVGLDGSWLRVNARLCEIVGYSREELLTKTFQDITHPDDLQADLENVRQLLAGEIQTYMMEKRYFRKDRSIVWINLTVALVREEATGAPRYFISVVEDITARRRAEVALRESEEQLRERAEELERTDRAKDQFLAMLAHELRNPIGAISNAVHLVKRLGPAEPLIVRAQEIMERQVAHTARLLDDLLNVSRIARGMITLQTVRVDLVQLLRSAADDFRGLADAAGLSLALELPEHAVWAEADPTRLAQVVANLLHNAVKFTERGGRVTMQLSVEAEPPRAAIIVRDTGIGIEPAVLPHIFEPLAQADLSLDRSRGGLGLGLPLVKGLVELHGGDVQVKSAGPGRGAEFTVHLPIAPSSLVPAAAAAPPALPTGPLRVLVVEDNQDAATSLHALLQLWGCVVAVAYSGDEALALAPQFQPHVVLCDLGLPGISGYEVAVALKQQPATAATRLIAVSGYAQQEDQQRSLSAGFERHLAKPVDPEELQRLLAAGSAGQSDSG
jgi:PAS domain S-box-containing protein